MPRFDSRYLPFWEELLPVSWLASCPWSATGLHGVTLSEHASPPGSCPHSSPIGISESQSCQLRSCSGLLCSFPLGSSTLSSQAVFAGAHSKLISLGKLSMISWPYSSSVGLLSIISCSLQLCASSLLSPHSPGVYQWLCPSGKPLQATAPQLFLLQHFLAASPPFFLPCTLPCSAPSLLSSQAPPISFPDP